MSYYLEFPLEYERDVLDEQEKIQVYIKIGPWYFSPFRQKTERWKTITEEYPLRLTENFCLPINFGRITLQKYHTETAFYTENEAKSIAVERLHIYEEKLIQKGVQISENNVKIEMNRTACVSKGTLTVIEKTGIQTEVAQQEQP